MTTNTIAVSRTNKRHPVLGEMIVFEIEHEGRTHAVPFEAADPAHAAEMQRAARGAFARATGLPAEAFVFPS